MNGQDHYKTGEALLDAAAFAYSINHASSIVAISIDLANSHFLAAQAYAAMVPIVEREAADEARRIQAGDDELQMKKWREDKPSESL